MKKTLFTVACVAVPVVAVTALLIRRFRNRRFF